MLGPAPRIRATGDDILVAALGMEVKVEASCKLVLGFGASSNVPGHVICSSS